MKALIVDDSRATRRVIGSIVQSLGYEIVEAGNGREGLERLQQMEMPDIVLIDWNMPEMNGLEMIKAIRSNDVYEDLPLMMVTTETEIERMAEAFVAGVNEYVMKPFNAEMIQEKFAILGLGI